MAEKDHLEELEKEITCAVCHNVYKEAKHLPCNHYYCSTCIEKMATRSESLGEPLYCPECRKEAKLPPGGAADLQPAFVIERLKSLYEKLMAKVCEQCGSARSVSYCRQCGESMCSDCTDNHRKMKVKFTGHVIVNLNEIPRGEKNKLPFKRLGKTCTEHDKACELYCFDCTCLICCDCTLIKHKGHNFDFLSSCTSKTRSALQECLDSIQEMQADIAVAEKSIAGEEDEVEEQKVEVVKSIDQRFEELKEELEARKTELVMEARLLAEEKKKALASQRKELHAAQKEVSNLIGFMESKVEKLSDQDLMGIRGKLQKEIDEEEKRHRRLPLEPATNADIACYLPSCDIIPNDLGSVFLQPSPTLFKTMESCELGSSVEVCLFAANTSTDNVSATLICLADPSISLAGKVGRKAIGTFNISVTPKVRGRHNLIVKVKDKEIEGSPFSLYVTFPASRLGKEELCRIDGLRHPWGIAVNQTQLIVAETGWLGGKMVAILEKGGKKVSSIECDQLNHPYGVAVASDGAIYVTDTGNKCLLKFDPEGKLVHSVCEGLQDPYSIRIINNLLYVVDTTSALVKIFDLDCKVVSTIKTNESPYPRDVALGPDGLYLASDKKISVYNATSGAFVHHLNLSPATLTFSQFRGICFDGSGRNIIVTDLDYGVYVFKPSGEFVCQIPSSVIKSPAGIAVDEDGYVFVSQCPKYIMLGRHSVNMDAKIFIL